MLGNYLKVIPISLYNWSNILKMVEILVPISYTCILDAHVKMYLVLYEASAPGSTQYPSFYDWSNILKMGEILTPKLYIFPLLFLSHPSPIIQLINYSIICITKY